MAEHDVAYFREQGQNLVVVMVRWADVQSKGESAVLDYVRYHATNAGLVGQTAICWESGGRPYYYGPPDLVRFLSSVPYILVPWNHRLVIP
jgi:hypothetical protein